MKEQVVSHYKVLEQIGEGSMGVVYRAQDLRLGRQVALKFLPPSLAGSPSALQRFRREAESVSALNHPHICTLYDIGEHEGRHFLVLELLEGRSLKQLLGDGQLAVDRVIEIAAQIADALDAAHAKGIVHRDVKPGNILITDRGNAKLLDFGVARPGAAADEAARTADMTREALTSAGAWIGTPDYMAPEQLRGAPADARSDLYALGAVIFEMVTGRRVTIGRTESPSPPELNHVIRKLLEHDPALRYQTAKDLLIDLRRLGRDTTRSGGAADSRPRSRVAMPLVAGATVLAAVVAGGWWLTRDRSTTSTTPYESAASSTNGARLVVLPFENLTRQQDDDWLSGALADSIGAALQTVETLILVPRERVVELYAAESRRDADALSADLAEQLSKRLRVRFYVHGSYQKVGDSVRIAARLVDVEGDAVTAQETLTGPFANVLQLEDQLATRFAARLGQKATRTTFHLATESRADATADLEAYRLVSDARTLYGLSQFANARPMLQSAIERDPKYALAWAMLSKVESRLSSPAAATGPPSSESLKAALDAATRAVELAPTSAESQIALSLAHRGYVNRGPMAEAAQKAMTLDPQNGEARIILGGALSIAPGFGCPTSPRPAESEAALREGLRVDPLGAAGYLNLTTQLWWMNRAVEALAILDQGLALSPNNLLLTTSRPFNLVFADRVDEGEAILDRRASSPVARTPNDILTRGYIALRRRDYATASAVFTDAPAKQALGNLAWRLISATAHFQADRSHEGAALLAQAVREEPSCAQWATIVPALAPYQGLAEFRRAIATSAR